MSTTNPQLLDARDLGKRLSIKPETLLAWARRGMIPHYRLGTLVRFDPQEVLAWVQDGHRP